MFLKKGERMFNLKNSLLLAMLFVASAQVDAKKKTDETYTQTSKSCTSGKYDKNLTPEQKKERKEKRKAKKAAMTPAEKASKKAAREERLSKLSPAEKAVREQKRQDRAAKRAAKRAAAGTNGTKEQRPHDPYRDLAEKEATTGLFS